tara:strand:- start:662 stop:862 length:201 start_codon:yes stop_codon:yes gene_type:complete
MNFQVSFTAQAPIPGIKPSDHAVWVPTLKEAEDLLYSSKGGIIFDSSGEPIHWWMEGAVKNRKTPD